MAKAMEPTTTEEMLAAGWQALARTEWGRARSLFTAAVGRGESADALEGLSLSAWWLDDAETMFATRERAYRLYRSEGNLRSAGRLATLFGIDYFSFRGEAAIGNGWFRIAHRLLRALPPCPEQGWLWIWEGQIRLLVDNNPAEARRLGHEAAELGRALGDVDIEMTGLGLDGLAAVAAGDIGEGMTKLDEATATAVSGDMVEPAGIGATCCYLIFACERVRDFDRAVQWCERLQELCRQWQWGSLFATCRTHHAGVLLWQGAWNEAERQLEAATRELETSRPGKVADGLLRLAELRRRQGRLEEAERLLERVGFSPHALLGLAALALDRDQAADALDLVDRLEALTDAITTDPMRASAALARGLLAHAEGDAEGSRRHLEDALDLFRRSGAPFEAAQTRLELARVLIELGRNDLALREARSAESALAAMGAGLAARRARALLRELGASPTRARRAEPTFGLSARELEVLALVAQGHGNQRIAEMLVLSEHTIRRHVANILRKMDVQSRTAAATVATRENLL